MSKDAQAHGCIQLFGLSVDDVKLRDAAELAVNMAASNRRHDVAFVNAHCINVAVGDEAYQRALHGFQRRYADGSGMRLAARLAGHALRDNVNGTDLFPLLCELAARDRVPIALLGAKPGVADRCAASISQRFPGLEVVWKHHGYAGHEQMPDLVKSVNESGARILFVALGVPKQELWIAQHRCELTVPVTLAVGALLDFFSGDVPRAPLWLRRLGLEWAFRLANEPRRLFRRYVLGNPLFLCRALWLASRQRLREAPLAPREGK